MSVEVENLSLKEIDAELAALAQPLQEKRDRLSRHRQALIDERGEVDRKLVRIDRALKSIAPEAPKPPAPTVSKNKNISDEKLTQFVACVREHGPILQVEVAKKLGWSSGTITAAVRAARSPDNPITPGQEIIRIVGEEIGENGGRASKVLAVYEGS